MGKKEKKPSITQKTTSKTNSNWNKQMEQRLHVQIKSSKY